MTIPPKRAAAATVEPAVAVKLISLRRFLREHSLSRATFYRLNPSERPVTVRVGKKLYIRTDDADAWRNGLETVSTQPRAQSLHEALGGAR